VALSPTRLEFRLKLSHVDRGVELDEPLIVARHPSETQAHVVLRVLAWCLLHEEGLEMGPGLSSPDAADLWRRDATGTLTTWVECGSAACERLRKLQQHHPGLDLHVVLDDARRADELTAELQATKLPRAARPPTIWVLPTTLTRPLAEREERRQRWTVTIVGDHFYIDVDGSTVEGAASRRSA
jgi:uncharacterized protein YaeQ